MCDSNAIYDREGNKMGTSKDDIKTSEELYRDAKEPRVFFEFVGICEQDLIDDDKKLIGELVGEFKENKTVEVLSQEDVNKLNCISLKYLYSIYSKRFIKYFGDAADAADREAEDNQNSLAVGGGRRTKRTRTRRTRRTRRNKRNKRKSLKRKSRKIRRNRK